MRTQELVHLHALCDALRAYLEECRDVPPEAFRRYHEHGVSPTAINRNKRAHEEALSRLLDGFVAVGDVDGDVGSDSVSTRRDAPAEGDG